MHGLDLWKARPRSKALGAEPAPFAAGRGSHRKACDPHNAAPCTAQFVGGGSPSGRSFSGSEPAPFAADRASHRRACDLHNAAPCTGSICGSPALGAKLWAPSRRHSPRVAAPTEKRATGTAQRHARAQFLGGPPSGRSFRAPSRRHSPRVAPPTEKRATCPTQRHARARFVGGPPSGRSFGRRAGAIRRRSRLPQKSARPAQRSAMHGLNLWVPRPRREAFRAPSRRHSPRVAAPTEKHASCTTQRHARAQFVGGPPSGRSCSSTEPAPFAAGRGSPRKSARPA